MQVWAGTWYANKYNTRHRTTSLVSLEITHRSCNVNNLRRSSPETNHLIGFLLVVVARFQQPMIVMWSVIGTKRVRWPYLSQDVSCIDVDAAHMLCGPSLSRFTRSRSKRPSSPAQMLSVHGSMFRDIMPPIRLRTSIVLVG